MLSGVGCLLLWVQKRLLVMLVLWLLLVGCNLLINGIVCYRRLERHSWHVQGQGNDVGRSGAYLRPVR